MCTFPPTANPLRITSKHENKRHRRPHRLTEAPVLEVHGRREVGRPSDAIALAERRVRDVEKLLGQRTARNAKKKKRFKKNDHVSDRTKAHTVDRIGGTIRRRYAAK